MSAAQHRLDDTMTMIEAFWPLEVGGTDPGAWSRGFTFVVPQGCC